MDSGSLQKRFAETRFRFGISLLTLIAVPTALSFVFLSNGAALNEPSVTVLFILLLVLGIAWIGLYILRLRQIQRPIALAALVFVPVVNIALPIFLLIENSPSERVGKHFFVTAGLGTAAFIGLASYFLTNPPGFSRADATGCYFADGKSVFQFRNGRVLLPSGVDTGVSYRIESSGVGNLVVSDHELKLVRSNTGFRLAIGVAEDRWNPSVDRFGGPQMVMTAVGDDLQPIMAVRYDSCS